MHGQLQAVKRWMLDTLAQRILGNPFLERGFCQLCAQPWLRQHLRLSAIAFACVAASQKLELRVAELGTHRLWVDISEYSGMMLYFFRAYDEPFTAWLLAQLVRPGDVCIDVGAHMGSYTFVLAAAVGKTGQVIAFEPQAALNELLQKSSHLNGFDTWVRVDNRALYQESALQLKFYISEDERNSQMSSLINWGQHTSDDYFVVVETITLPDYFQEAQLQTCRLLKIDVEGADLEVLQGMAPLLQTQAIDYIVLEQCANSPSQQVLDAVGYTCWLIDEKTRSLVDVAQVPTGQFSNYLFVSPRATSLLRSPQSPRLAGQQLVEVLNR